ncbi:MAG: hypothetical protein WAM60_15340 [Candidatus Promineifilaceae bacterium]
MRIVVLVLLFLGAHFAGTAFVPGPRASIVWPFGNDSRPLLAGVGGLPTQSGGVVTPVLAGLSVLAFVAAFAALVGILVPAEWFVPLVAAGSLTSTLLYLLFAGPLSILPIAIDLFLLWGVLINHWTVPVLRG